MAKERFTKIPIADVTGTPSRSGFYDLVRDSYWAVTEDDCILLYVGYSRQCNTNKSITDMIVSGEKHPGVKTVYLAEVWLPHNCNDYA